MITQFVIAKVDGLSIEGGFLLGESPFPSQECLPTDPSFSRSVFLPQDCHEFSEEWAKFASKQALLDNSFGSGRIGYQVGQLKSGRIGALGIFRVMEVGFPAFIDISEGCTSYTRWSPIRS